jgi:hypothetical protein
MFNISKNADLILLYLVLVVWIGYFFWEVQEVYISLKELEELNSQLIAINKNLKELLLVSDQQILKDELEIAELVKKVDSSDSE